MFSPLVFVLLFHSTKWKDSNLIFSLNHLDSSRVSQPTLKPLLRKNSAMLVVLKTFLITGEPHSTLLISCANEQTGVVVSPLLPQGIPGTDPFRLHSQCLGKWHQLGKEAGSWKSWELQPKSLRTRRAGQLIGKEGGSPRSEGSFVFFF